MRYTCSLSTTYVRSGLSSTITTATSIIVSFWTTTVLYIISPRRCRSATAYSCQTFPWTICWSVGAYVRRSAGLSSALWKNGESDPDAVWRHRSDGSRDEAGSGVGSGIGPREGVLLGPNLERAIVTNGHLSVYVCDSAATWPSSQITLGIQLQWHCSTSGCRFSTCNSESFCKFCWSIHWS